MSSRFDDWDDEEGSGSRRIAVIAAAVVAALALAWLVVVPALRDDGGEAVSLPTDPAVPGSSGADSTSSAATPRTTVATSTTRDAPLVAASVASAGGSSMPVSRPGSTSPTTRPDAVAPAATGATTAPPPAGSAAGQASYPTLPDGSPVPVIAIFDVETITLSGTVPSEAAAERLKTLAITNSKFPASVVEFLAIDPTVPANVPVRVLELTSARFPEGSAEVLPEHALELDRVATVMEALPNVTVLVVGHADQRGDEMTNYRLSEGRAQAVVSYLASKGIDPARMSSRAVGEADLITLADDEAALALNRRTEFVFSGLLVGA